jgi:MATE efflux family protein
MNESTLKKFIRYSINNIFGMMAISVYILADTFFIARGVGTLGLTALNIAIPAFSFIQGSGLMLGIGAATKYSILKAQGQEKGANEIFSLAVISGLIISLFFVFLSITASKYLVKILGADESIFDITVTYLRVILCFAPSFIINAIFLCFVRNDHAPALAMIAMVIGSFSNIVLDYIFVFPLNMGMFGAALATGCAPVIGLCILSLHKLRGKNNFKLVKYKLDFIKIFGILKLGLPSLITELASGVVIIVFNILILGISGNIGVAAYGIIANISMVVTAIYTGVSQAIQPLLSNCYGLKDTSGMKKIFKYALVLMLALSLVIYVILYFYASDIAFIFNKENDNILQTMAVEGLKVYFTATPFLGFNIIISIVFISMEKAVPAQIISLCRGFFILVPSAVILSKVFLMLGVWLSLLFCECVVAIISIYFLYRLIKSREIFKERI